MRFNSIKIKNYRQYKDVYFDFEKTNINDIHIIIASNGVGKTNILNAINWCLYGDEPHTSGVDSDTNLDKLPICNIQAAEEAKEKGKNTCEVEIKIVASENEEVFTISRTIEVDVFVYNQKGRDKFEVVKKNINGETKFLNEEESIEEVNKFLPKKIREYFYFDGEKLLHYFDSERNKHIKDSIKEISQVTIIDRVEKHLNDTIKKFNDNVNELSPNLEKKYRAVQEEREKIENEKLQLEKLNEEISIAKKRIKEIDKSISGVESVVDDNNKYNENNKRIKELEENLKDIKDKLTLFIRNYTIFIYLYETNKRTEKYIEEKTKENSINPNLNIDLVKSTLRTHKCEICGEELKKEREEYLENILRELSSNNLIQKLIEIKNDVIRGKDIFKYKKILNEYYSDIDNIEEEIKKINQENNKLINKISIVSDVDGIAFLIDEKKMCEKTLTSNTEKVGAYKYNIEKLCKNLDDLEMEYELGKRNNEKCKELNKKIEFVENARKIVSNVKNDIIEVVKSQMEIQTMEIFEQLSWKENTYDRIELDDNFKLKIFHKKTNLSCLNSCSAAEKELLALAFTIALHKVSGYDNLLFIDTPVGRVSDVNREKFSQVLLDVSKNKQIILAFTPSEYSDEIKGILKNNVVSTINKLETDEETTNFKEV